MTLADHNDARSTSRANSQTLTDRADDRARGAGW
jgi:hypothetical protein